MIKDERLTPEERKLRDLLWATHPCFGKYGDDGEIQCGCFLPAIDFLRDKPEEIEAKIPLHNAQLAKARQPDREKALYETRVVLWRYFKEQLTSSAAEDIAEEIYNQIIPLLPDTQAIRREVAKEIGQKLMGMFFNPIDYDWNKIREYAESLKRGEGE